MAEEKALTKSELVTALKGLREQVKQDIQDAVHDQLTNYHADMVAPEIEKLKAEMKIGLRQMNSRLERLEADVRWAKNNLKDLKADLSDTPSRREFDSLKIRLDELTLAT